MTRKRKKESATTLRIVASIAIILYVVLLSLGHELGRQLENQGSRNSAISRSLQENLVAVSDAHNAPAAVHEKRASNKTIKTKPIPKYNPPEFLPVRANGTTWILPNSRFTHHISKLVDLFDPETKSCGQTLTVEVQPDTSPSSLLQNVTLGIKNETTGLSNLYRQVFSRRVLKSVHDGEPRVLPFGKLSLSISPRDGIEYPKVCALGSSAPKGFFSVFNYEDVWGWKYNRNYPPPLHWSKRSKIPVWRGAGYVGVSKEDRVRLVQELEQNLKDGVPAATDLFLGKVFNSSSFHKRLLLCHFSTQNPDLVDAKLSRSGGIPKEWWPQNATNGLNIFLPFDQIPKKEYYTKYQVSIVMGGIKAAFRLGPTMSQGIAVMLQDFPHEEWYTQYLTPFVHYIPLSRNLSDLNEKLRWVKNNPKKVKAIAMEGKDFYQRYLSYDAMDEFYYELIFRLLMKVNSIE